MPDSLMIGKLIMVFGECLTGSEALVQCLMAISHDYSVRAISPTVLDADISSKQKPDEILLN